MPVTVTVALLGFGLLERQLLESRLSNTMLRDAARKADPLFAFEPTRDAVGADLVVANVDDPEVTDLVRRLGLLGRTVGIGKRPLPCVARQLARPLDIAAVADALARLAPSCTPRAAEPPGAQVARVLEQLAFFVHRAGWDRHATSGSAGEPAGHAR